MSGAGFSFLSPEAVIRAVHLQEGTQVADFFAGSGFFTRAAARAVGPAGRVWALDPRHELLARLKNTTEMEGLTNVEVVRANIEERHGTLLPETSVHAVLMVGALSASEHARGILEEAARVLKPSGRAIVIDWKASFEGLGPHPEHVVSREQAMDLAQQAGFEKAEELAAGDYHWGVVLRKKSV